MEKFQELNNMRKYLIYSPNFFLGHTKINKNAANYHQFQGKKNSWWNQSFGLCQLQSRKTLPTAGNFLEYHGNWFVFHFEMSINVISLKYFHPYTDHHHIRLSQFQ